MRKTLTFVGFLILAVSVQGCFIKAINIKDGRIPQELVPAAVGLVGSYHGVWEGDSVSLEMEMNEGNRPALTFSQDLLRPTCKSSIGELTRIDFTKNRKDETKIRGVVFRFDPGNCDHIEGRHLYADVFRSLQGDLVLDLNILARTEFVQNCQPVFYPGHPGYPWQNCGWVSVRRYFNGQVIKDGGLIPEALLPFLEER